MEPPTQGDADFHGPPVPGPNIEPFGIGYAILGFFVAFVAAQVMGGVLVVAVIGLLLLTGVGAMPQDAPSMVALANHPIPLLIAAIASSAAFFGTAWGTCVIANRPWDRVLGLARAPVAVCAIAVVGVAALGILVDEGVHLYMDQFPQVTLGVLEGFATAARAEGPVMRVFAVTSMALVPGFCEEVFFRGFLQRSFVKRLGATLGILLASVAFGAVHLDPPQALGAMATGLYLGWLAYRTASIAPSIAAHVANNALAYLSANVPALGRYGSSGEHYPAAVLIAAAVVTLLAISGVSLIVASRSLASPRL